MTNEIELMAMGVVVDWPCKAVAWKNWAQGDTVRYMGSGEHGEDCHLCMTIGSDYLIHESPDEFETMIVLDDEGDEWSVLVGEFEHIAICDHHAGEL